MARKKLSTALLQDESTGELYSVCVNNDKVIIDKEPEPHQPKFPYITEVTSMRDLTLYEMSNGFVQAGNFNKTEVEAKGNPYRVIVLKPFKSLELVAQQIADSQNLVPIYSLQEGDKFSFQGTKEVYTLEPHVGNVTGAAALCLSTGEGYVLPWSTPVLLVFKGDKK
jgi:hypothetical protein